MADRLLLRLSFDGTRFHGTQRQSDVDTVNGRVLGALADAGLLAAEPRLRAQGRVDAGVSARDFPVALDAEADLGTVAATIAGRVPGVIPFAGCEVAAGFDPRLATRSRTYRYHLPPDPTVDPSLVQRTWDRFEGLHDLEALARVDPDRSPRTVRRIERTRSWTRPGGGTVLEVRAPTFLHHQVRRMVGATLTVARGRLEPGRLDAALAGKGLPNHAKRSADPEGLILHRVALGADWRPLPRAEAVASRRLDEARSNLEQRLRVAERVQRPSSGTTTRTRRRA